MLVKVLALVLLSGTLLQAQSTLNYRQLRELIESSLRQGHSDKEVAEYLKRQNLGFALSDAVIEDFIGIGIGPKTLNVLRKLQPETQGRPAPDTTRVIPPEKRQPPPPSEQEQARIIATARRSALDYIKGLPDYICLQVTRRYLDPTGLEMDWLKYDEVKARVGYFEGRENYELVSINNKITDKSFDDIGGASSTGEFGSMLASLFAPETEATFSWARHSLLRGRPVYVFSTYVSRNRSRWRISYHREREIITAYRGLVYIDKETERVLRLTIQATDVPSDFPIREANTRLDYDFIAISGREFLLPLKARVGMREGTTRTRNDVEFRLYRKFTAEATISFEEIESLEPLPEEEQ